MYFWNIGKLKDAIRSDRLNEDDRFFYLLIYVVFSAITIEVMSLLRFVSSNSWDLFESCANILIVLIGTVFAFIANGSGKGNDFLGRYFSIGFVVTIRFMIFSLPLFAIYALYPLDTLAVDKNLIAAVDITIYLLWIGLMYWRIYFHVKDVNTPQTI